MKLPRRSIPTPRRSRRGTCLRSRYPPASRPRSLRARDMGVSVDTTRRLGGAASTKQKRKGAGRQLRATEGLNCEVREGSVLLS
jgi:hypothetical protein